MDFATVRKKLGNGAYSTLEQFEVGICILSLISPFTGQWFICCPVYSMQPYLADFIAPLPIKLFFVVNFSITSLRYAFIRGRAIFESQV